MEFTEGIASVNEDGAAITAKQIKDARSLLGWLPSKLADRAKITTGAVRRAEGIDGGSLATLETLAAIKRALEAAGIEFTAGEQPGVRIRMNT